MAKTKKFSLIDSFKIPFKYTPIYATIITLEQLLWGFVLAIETVILAKVIDTALSISKGTAELSSIFGPIIGMIAISLYVTVMRHLAVYIEVRMSNKLRVTYVLDLVDQQAKLEYKHIENPDSWDLISRVMAKPEQQVMNAYYNLLMTARNIITIVSVMFVFATQVWWAALLLLVASIPLLKIAVDSGKVTYEATRDISKNKRKAEYLSTVLSNRDAVAERTLFDYGDVINDRWSDEYEIARKGEIAAKKKMFIKSNKVTFIFKLVTILVIFILINPVIAGVVTMGMFISLVKSLNDISGLVGWQLPSQLTGISNTREYLKDLTEFHELESKQAALNIPASPPLSFDTIEFKNVSFTYPGTTAQILKNTSFTLKKGKHYAFVGINGAGKTTITKLLTGLYNNFEGEILINGKSINDYTHEEVKSLSAVVYQDFARYSISLKDNILIGDMRNLETQKGEQQLKFACDTFGLNEVIEKLPNGVNSNLGKAREDGLDLSGGEWQRVALARGMVSPASLIILDEPTAALDPISESKVYSEFELISRSRTTVFISHRLGSTKLADHIIVIGEGTVLEQGTHNELMDNNGLYAEMYTNQRSWYSE